MKKYNLTGVAKMIQDVKTGNFRAYSQETPEKFNEAIRAKFNELMPKPNASGNIKRRDLMKALPAVFAIIEEVVDVTVNDAWKSDPFYSRFVDSRNLMLGDKPSFYVNDGTWIVANRFSGGSWDTDREKLNGRKKVDVETEWFYVHVYDDFERFKTGAITVEEFMEQITRAFITLADTLVAVAFNDAATRLPATFNVASTLSTADVRELVAKVKTYSRTGVAILGTEMATSQLNELAEIKYSEAMMNEMYSTGRLGKWLGTDVIEIPQAFEPGTYNWAVDNNTLLVVPNNEKFIKFVDEGETMSQEKTEQDNHDQTISWQLQRKLGAAAIFGSIFGKYTII
jgi:hypothetical protein